MDVVKDLVAYISIYIITIIMVLNPMLSSAQLSIVNFNTVNQSFNGLGVTAPSALPTGWRGGGTSFSGSGTSVPDVAGTANGSNKLNNQIGFINLGVGVNASATDRAIGFAASSTAITYPRNIYFQFTNNTGSTVYAVDLSWQYEKYRTGTRATSWTFLHGTDTTVGLAENRGGEVYLADATGGTISALPDSVLKSFTLSGLDIPNGSTYYFKWIFTGTGGSDNTQVLAIDNFSIRLNNPNVDISSGNYVVGANQILNNLSLSSPGTLSIDALATLTIKGVFSMFGGTITNNGALFIDNTGIMQIDPGVSVGLGGSFINHGSVVLNATTPSSYAQLLNTGTVSGSGSVTQERAITGSTTGWRFVSASVTGGTLASFGSNILINNGPPNNIIALNTANPNAWVSFHALGGSSSTLITAGQGYSMYYGGSTGVNGLAVASTLSLSGTMRTSDLSISGLSAGDNTNEYGWSLVGNPFTTGINLSGLIRSGVNEAYYIWDVDKLGGAGFASYVGTTSNPSGSLNGVIPPMQGFLVKATSTTPELTIPTSARTLSTPNPQLRGATSFTHRMYIRVTEPQSGKWDETAVVSDPSATALFEGSFDAYKLNSWSTNMLNLSTLTSQNERLSINTTGDWDAALQVPLQLTTTLNGPMQLTTNLSEVAAGQAVWLEDLHTGAYHDLRAGAYAFTHLSNVADRFRIHFRALSTSVSPDPLAGVQLYAHDGRVFVRGWDGPFALEVYDLQGRRVIADAFEAGEGHGGWVSGVVPGIYVVRYTTEQGARSAKLRL